MVLVHQFDITNTVSGKFAFFCMTYIVPTDFGGLDCSVSATVRFTLITYSLVRNLIQRIYLPSLNRLFLTSYHNTEHMSYDYKLEITHSLIRRSLVCCYNFHTVNMCLFKLCTFKTNGIWNCFYPYL